MSLCADLAGGSGTVFMLWLQKKYRFSVKAGVFYGACMTLPPSIWGAIGAFTGKIGFHRTWEFWLAMFWNFQTAAWGSYQVTMISEVVPAPKAYMFFAVSASFHLESPLTRPSQLFNLVGKTSGFIGPFISSAIIKRANGNNNMCFWFLLGMGIIGIIVLYFVDPDQAKIDVARCKWQLSGRSGADPTDLEREAAELYSAEQREQQASKLHDEDEEEEGADGNRA